MSRSPRCTRRSLRRSTWRIESEFRWPDRKWNLRIREMSMGWSNKVDGLVGKRPWAGREKSHGLVGKMAAGRQAQQRAAGPPEKPDVDTRSNRTDVRMWTAVRK